LAKAGEANIVTEDRTGTEEEGIRHSSGALAETHDQWGQIFDASIEKGKKQISTIDGKYDAGRAIGRLLDKSQYCPVSFHPE
jgi:hypothetical protein